MDLLNAVAKSEQRVHCWLVGGGPQKDALAARAAQNDLVGRVHFLPNQDHTALAEIMSAFDVFALPSRTVGNWKEQFGRVIAEAGAAGIAVIGSDSGAIPDVIGDAGIVFPEGDETAIADAIRTLLEQPALRAEYGANGRRRAEELFSWQPVAKQYSDLLLYLSGLKERPDFTQNIV
jgi:glycosyltransferase involved in cell wall biosynthesis